jgi:hypothetical protein
MNSISKHWPPAFGVLLAALILAFVGCNSSRRDETDPGAGVAKNASGASDEGEAQGSTKLLASWPTGPNDRFAGALIVTGEMLGYHEPCGCQAEQKGGLVRRATLVELLRRQGWDLGLIDLGALIQDPAQARGGPDQAKLKFAYSLKALQAMDYRAVALAPEDLKLGTAEVLMQLDNTLGETPESLKAIAANATPAPDLGFEKRLRPSVRMQVGPVKVGVTAVLDPSAFEALSDPDKAALLTVITPEEALPAVLADLEADTNIQVLMVQGPPEMARRLAQAFPGFDLVVATSSTPDPDPKPVELNGGKTWLIGVGKKGMYAGVVGLYVDPKQRFRYQRVELNRKYDPHRELAASVRNLIGDDFQAALKSTGVLENYPKRPYALFNAPPDAIFVGAETCKSCHPNTFAKWASTKHAHAYEPLVNDPRDDGRNREFDAACVSCHTTGFDFIGGFVTADRTPYLKGNQCENCHGPGSRHAAEPDNVAFRQAMARSRDDFDRNHRCIACHDEDNDPKFNFDTYWPQIMHSKLDSYADPSVHRGTGSGRMARQGEPAAER